MFTERKMIYAFRGWIAFVAFMDLGTAVRSYIEKRSFLSEKSNFSGQEQYVDGKNLKNIYLRLIA